MTPHDPSRIEWLVARARCEHGPGEFTDRLLEHLRAALGAEVAAIVAEPAHGGEIFHISSAVPYDLDRVSGLYEAITAGTVEDALLHSFDEEAVSGTVLLRPAPASVDVDVMASALKLFDLVCALALATEEASRDPLTGMWNRREMALALDRAIAAGNRYPGRTFAIAMIDLDHFKWFNDTFGHPAGDELLVEVARVLSVTIRASDSAARWAGDEFMLLLPEAAEPVDAVLDRIRAKLDGYLSRYARDGIRLGFSAGVGYFPADGLDTDTLVRRADERLYEAKQALRFR